MLGIDWGPYLFDLIVVLIWFSNPHPSSALGIRHFLSRQTMTRMVSSPGWRSRMCSCKLVYLRISLLTFGTFAICARWSLLRVGWKLMPCLWNLKKPHFIKELNRTSYLGGQVKPRTVCLGDVSCSTKTSRYRNLCFWLGLAWCRFSMKGACETNFR